MSDYPQGDDRRDREDFYGNNRNNEDLEPVMRVRDWLLIMLLMCIPCVNIIMVFVFAFGGGNRNRSNYFKATLIWSLIWIVIGIISVFAFGTWFSDVITEIDQMAVAML